MDKSRYDEELRQAVSAGTSQNQQHGRFHLPGHKNNKSKEETNTHSPQSTYSGNGSPFIGNSPRIQTPRDRSPVGYHRDNESFNSTSPLMTRSALNSARLASPLHSARSMAGDRTPGDGSSSTKRTLFDRLRGKDKNSSESLRSQPGSQKSLDSNYHRTIKLEPVHPRKSRDASIATYDSGTIVRPSESDQNEITPRKESKSRLLGHNYGKSLTPTRSRFASEEPHSAQGPPTGESYWALDTNLDDMDGIVSANKLDTPYSALPTGVTQPDWDAPDSWHTKKLGDSEDMRIRESREYEDEDTGIPHGLRVFRIDGTFATLSTGVNITAAEILQILGKKSFLQDDLNTYQIIMKKVDAQRQLSAGERPVAIQRHLLERAGYEPNDGIEEIGRDDNSYLCRFTFVPTKITGYYSLDQNAGLDRITNFAHIDLAGCSLVTIPIVLYKKSAEICSLDLSKNLALDVPKDFIQSCTHLREIKFTGNESWRLPLSFSLASKLTILDISNNHLETLEVAQLGKLTNLASLKVANNKLRTLPRYFSELQQLRNLNLSSNYFDELPDVLYELPSLIDLDLSFNTISTLPEIGRLKSLEKFAATNNSLTGSFAAGLKDLENLKEIDIRFNDIRSMDIISLCPNLEQLLIGHNKITSFEGKFRKLKLLHADHNPITRFDLKAPVPSLISLNLAAAKIAHLDDSLYERIQNVTKLVLNKNLFVNISSQIGRLSKLEYLSISKNALQTLPPTIGCLQELRFLDLHECNISKLPPEIWFCIRLDTLNLSSNVLESFPRLSSSLQPPVVESLINSQSGVKDVNASQDELGKLDVGNLRRPSYGSSSLLSVGSSPVGSTRKNSIVSIYGPGGRKASVITRTPTTESVTPLTRKDSNITSRLTLTFAGSLKYLSMAENRLTDDIFEMICLLQELKSLNLSYNEIDDIPQNALRRWPNITDLYLSGNNLTSLPTDDLAAMDNHSLSTLLLNDNKFSNLPAELGKIRKLACLDIGCNNLKYNVSNYRYDWNWNFNQNLKYLNFSGNRRLEIKPAANAYGSGNHPDTQDLTNFNNLHHMRILGLMDVTLTIPNVPDENVDRRIRTSGTSVGFLKYGMSDSLGKDDHLSIIDLVKPKFRSHDTETLVGMFDGRSLTNQGSTVAKFLHENFASTLTNELNSISPDEGPADALRRTFLALNKDLATVITATIDHKAKRSSLPPRGTLAGQMLTPEDLTSGGVATVLFLDNMELYVANVGDAQAMLIHSGGSYHRLTTNHDPASVEERSRIREAGGFVSRHGKLNDDLDVSRAFGYIKHIPSVIAAPSIEQRTLTEQDEMILIASKELWEYIIPDLAIDIARSERGDPMRAAQRLRDLAIAFGATNKIMVMLVGVSDLKKREQSRTRGNTLSMGPGSFQEEQVYAKRRPGRDPNAPLDSSLARLDREILAPIGHLALVFTDIKSSTALWELFPVAMRSAIKIHNEVLRRQLRIIGGYEVKTEGDAFMVSFPTATAALLWCFTVQSLLLNAAWPDEILQSIHGQEILDADDNVIYRGLSVRMGAHWGDPVCEPDPITKRMDYFGQMVNKASRISSVADGGQITVSQDFINEIQKTLDTYAEGDRANSAASEDTMMDEVIAQTVRRDLRALSMQGFEVKELGERKLKGLENPERVYLMYPHVLAARLTAATLKSDTDPGNEVAPAVLSRDTQLSVNPETIWALWNVSLRLEMLCSSLETPGLTELRHPETGMLERVKNRGGEVTDRVLIQFVDHLITRIEV